MRHYVDCPYCDERQDCCHCAYGGYDDGWFCDYPEDDEDEN